jgi:glycosyltransferase involved in cell wall biosynthesis
MAAAKARPKILWVMEPLIGGTLQHLECFLAHTNPGQFEVHLAVSAERDPSVRARFAAWREAGRMVHEVPMVRSPSPARDAVALARLLRLCRRERFDLVHTHAAKAGFLGRLAARLTGTPAVHTPHVFPFDRGGQPLADALYVRLERLAGRWTDRIVLLSYYQMAQLERRRIMPAARAEVVPNGVDAGALVPADRTEARMHLGLPADAFVVLAAGRLCRQKGFDLLVDAAAMAGAGEGGLLILIAGTGEDETALRAKVASSGLQAVVRMMGQVEDLGDHYAAADLVALPSRYEGCPYVLLEAMACGRPVACADVSGMGEFVRDGETGFLVPAGDPAAWAERLRSAAQDREGLARLGAAARASLRPEWQAARAAARLHELYGRVLAGTQEEERSPGGA